MVLHGRRGFECCCGGGDGDVAGLLVVGLWRFHGLVRLERFVLSDGSYRRRNF